MAAKKVGELMVNIFDYPHVPYWFTIGQAVQLMKMAFSGREHPEPEVILVFDEKYNLIGTLGRNDLLSGLGPEMAATNSPVTSELTENAGNGSLWGEQFGAEARNKAERPVSETMSTVKHFIGPDADIGEAAFMMLRYNLQMLPVLEGKKKLLGIVRMSEVFESLADAVIGD
ncbi:MAG TPA: CBS domain-containing protein [Dissulfurispiraceae bacterium]|nr:CBS domain-containing protein [Dissulfurispiraceae bacterium]